MIRNILFNILKSTILASSSVVNREWFFWSDFGNNPNFPHVTYGSSTSRINHILAFDSATAHYGTPDPKFLRYCTILAQGTRVESKGTRILHCLGDFSGFWLILTWSLFFLFCVQNKKHFQIPSFPHSLPPSFLSSFPFSFLLFENLMKILTPLPTLCLQLQVSMGSLTLIHKFPQFPTR